MAVGRKSCFVLVEVVEVEVESDRPIRSSVIVTAYLSRKKSRNPKLDAEVGRREKSKRVDLVDSFVFSIYLLWTTELGIILIIAYLLRCRDSDQLSRLLTAFSDSLHSLLHLR